MLCKIKTLNTNGMKIEVGKRYVTICGDITGPLQLSALPSRGTDPSIYPYFDPVNDRLYNTHGFCLVGTKKNNITGIYYDPAPTEKPYAIDTVTISLERYDRFVAIEKALKELYNEAKKHL